MKFKDAIAYSRNVVAAKVALRLGKTTARRRAKLYGTWTRLGFGSKTGIDVANEVAGLAARPREDAVAPDRPRQRRVRAGRRRHPDPARACPTRRWSTAGRSSSRTS